MTPFLFANSDALQKPEKYILDILQSYNARKGYILWIRNYAKLERKEYKKHIDMNDFSKIRNSRAFLRMKLVDEKCTNFKLS